MDISAFLIRFIFLVVPGIVTSSLYRAFRGKRAKKDWEDYLEILVFSVFNYVLFEIVFWAVSLLAFKILNGIGLNWIQENMLPSLGFEALLAFFDEKTILDKSVVVDIIGATVTSFVTALLASWVDEHKLLNRIAIKLRASKRFGDESIWYSIHREPSEHWKYVRDHKLKLIYYGWVERYSDWWDAERELYLKDVIIYDNESGKELYHVENMYISRKSDDLTIEFPNFVETKTKLEENKEKSENDKK